MEKLTKFVSEDKARICIYSGQCLVANFQNNDLGQEAYSLFLYGLQNVDGGGVYDADNGLTEMYGGHFNSQGILDSSAGQL